jgi:membrane complex biogenesis BtpA family protein
MKLSPGSTAPPHVGLSDSTDRKRAFAPRLVGVIHLPPLLGSPRSSLDARACARTAGEDARRLAAAGFDLAIVENFGDTPFFAGRVPAVTVAAMTACAIAAREAAPELPLGINVLRNDAESALAVAVAAEAACIRVNVLTGARVTDQGVVQGDAASLFRARRALGADGIDVWADVDVKHSAPLAARPLADEVADVVARSLAAAVLVTGEGTGRAVDHTKLEEVQRAVAGRVPVLVASGATIEGLSALASRCDGVIVGSALRAAGIAGGPVDEKRAHEFVRAFRAAFVS